MRRDLEKMGILVGLVQNADDVDAVAADLARDVAVEVLGRHHGEFAVGRTRGGNGAQRKR